MYWQPSILKFEPESAGPLKTDSLTSPRLPPAVRVTTIVAGGRLQVGLPLSVKVNFTGMTPRLTVNTLVPSALIGGCTCATQDGVGVVLHTPALPAAKIAWISDAESARLKI